jgi:hypothetical protein
MPFHEIETEIPLWNSLFRSRLLLHIYHTGSCKACHKHVLVLGAYLTYFHGEESCNPEHEHGKILAMFM